MTSVLDREGRRLSEHDLRLKLDGLKAQMNDVGVVRGLTRKKNLEFKPREEGDVNDLKPPTMQVMTMKEERERW